MNFRGSTGFGKDFLSAGELLFFGDAAQITEFLRSEPTEKLAVFERDHVATLAMEGWAIKL